MIYLKNSAKKNYFRKALYRISLAGLSICSRSWIYQGPQYGSGCKHTMVLYIQGFWRHLGSEYARILNMPGYWIYQGSEYVKFQNMSWFWIYQGSEYVRILNKPRLWIYRGYIGFRICRNIPGYFLNMPGYDWICQNVEQ